MREQASVLELDLSEIVRRDPYSPPTSHLKDCIGLVPDRTTNLLSRLLATARLPTFVTSAERVVMGSSYRIGRRGACIAIAAMLLTTTAFAEESAPTPQLGLELNKLEQQGEVCVVWMVLETELDTGFESLKLELVLFDTDGLIQRRLALDAAPLAAAKTMVKVFKVPAMRCDSVGRVLVNAVVACAGTKGPLNDCLERLRVSSRAEVGLIK